MTIRCCQYLNNVVGAGPSPGEGAALRPMLGIQDVHNARRVIIGIELAQKIHKRQLAIPIPWQSKSRGDLASRHGRQRPPRGGARLSYRSDNLICTRTPVLAPFNVVTYIVRCCGIVKPVMTHVAWPPIPLKRTGIGQQEIEAGT